MELEGNSLRDRFVVVAGNGSSIMELEPGRISSDDFIIRTNNFFFEPTFFLGRRVDIAFMGGDPRVAPFMFETLFRCRGDYDLRSWSSHRPRVVQAGLRRFGQCYQPMQYRDQMIQSEVQHLITSFQRQPTTGIFGVLMAHALGAEKIILAGMDFYSRPDRYLFEPGPNYKALMGHDIKHRGIDHQLHDVMLDLKVLQTLQARQDCQLFCASENTVTRELFELAPLRSKEALMQKRHAPPKDWSSWSGVYPISLLKLMRKCSAAVRKKESKTFSS